MEGQRAGLIRQEMERWEEAALSPFASLSSKSRGREKEEPACDIRPVYQRDRDRILHCKSFRRLKHTTQVFLRLNEELTEAIALGHDLGHAPFGHAGERALAAVSACGFAHNEQSVRVVEFLEKKGQGLNLTWEVRDGIRNHPTAGQPHTLEGKIVRLADKIAYINHDIDDAIRGGILAEEEIPLEYRKKLGFTTRERLNTLIHDVIYQSLGKPDICMSGEIEKAMGELRRFMFANVYTNPRAKGQEAKAENLLQALFVRYWEQPELLPEEYVRLMEEQGEARDRVVCDYIAGMTDQYATEKFQELYVPNVWSVR